jgi:hypothetical protein
MNDTPSLLVKFWPYWPNRLLPSRGRSVPLIITSVRKPRLPAVARATSSNGSRMALPCPDASRRRSAATIANAA